MANEAGLEHGDISELVRQGLKKETGKDTLLDEVKRDLADEGKMRRVEKVLLPFVDEARKIRQEMLPDIYDMTPGVSAKAQRVVATQLVMLHTLLATGKLDEMHNDFVQSEKEAGKKVPEPGSSQEIEQKIILAGKYIENISRRLTGEDEVGIELEYPKRIYKIINEIPSTSVGEKWGILKSDLLLSARSDWSEVDELENLGAFSGKLELLGAKELITRPGDWLQQIREIGALVMMGELQGRRIDGKETFNVHLTLPEVKLTSDDTRVMWIAPMLLAMGVSTVSEKRSIKAVEEGKKFKERVRKDNWVGGVDRWKNFPYHSTRGGINDNKDLERSTVGVELRSWLRVAIPNNLPELLGLYRGVVLAEQLRQFLVAEQKDPVSRTGVETKMVSENRWDRVVSNFKEILKQEGLDLPLEGADEMYRTRDGNHMSRYELMMSDLLQMSVKDPEKWQRIKTRTKALARDLNHQVGQFKTA